MAEVPETFGSNQLFSIIKTRDLEVAIIIEMSAAGVTFAPALPGTSIGSIIDCEEKKYMFFPLKIRCGHWTSHHNTTNRARGVDVSSVRQHHKRQHC